MKTTMNATVNNAAVMNNSAVMNELKSGLQQMGERVMESTPMVCLGLIVSIILGEDVSPLRALRLINVMVSGLCAFMLGGISIAVQILLLAWFALSIWSARK